MVEDKIRHFVKRNFEVVNPYSGVNSIKQKLIKNRAIVVQDDGFNLLGVLTPMDIIQKPHNLVVDCLSPKKAVTPECTIESVLQIMKEQQADALPVFIGDKFDGLVFKNDLVSHLKKLKENFRKKIAETDNNLKTSKRILKTFFDSTQSAIFLISPKYEIIFFNKKAYEGSLRLYSGKLKTGANLFDCLVIRDDELANFKLEFERSLHGEHIVTERRMQYPGGASSWVRIEYSPIYEEESLIGVALTFTNINEQKEYEYHIREQNRALTAISWMQSHKTRQPLATLLGLLSIVDKSNLSEYNSEVFKLLEDTANKLDDIIRTTIIRANSVLKDKF